MPGIGTAATPADMAARRRTRRRQRCRVSSISLGEEGSKVQSFSTILPPDNYQ
jgi:hypothetical protein